MVVPLVRRVFSAWWVYALGALFTAVFLTPVVRGWPGPETLSGFVAVGLCSILAAPFYNLWCYARTTDWSYARNVTPWFSAVCAAGSLLLTSVVLGLGAVLGAALAMAAAAAMVGAIRWMRGRLPDRVLRVSDSAHALELALFCDDALNDEAVAPGRRAALRLSLANALIALSAREDHDDVLPDAFALLDEALEDSRPDALLPVAIRILEATDLKWERRADPVGHDHALRLVMRVAERAVATDPSALSQAYAARAQSHLRRSRQAGRDGDAVEEGTLRQLAARDLRRAVAAAPPRSDGRALHVLALAEVDGPRPLDGDLDGAIARCRSALRRLWLVGAEERMPGYLVLADLLELRARLHAGHGRPGRWDRGTADLARALRLCLKLAAGEHALEARRRIPRLQQLLREREAVRGDVRGWMYRRLFAQELAASPAGAVATAAAWAGWAMERDDAGRAADAWQAWLTAVTADLRRRLLHDKQRRLPAIQAQVALAAQWMIRAGRPGEAAVALEIGRAVLLTERIQRQGRGLADRLAAIGEDERAAAWREAEAALRAEDRAHAGIGRRGAPTPYASAEYLALVEHERLVREISELPGFEDVDPRPAYADLRAAAADGPLVYLAATDDAGFALVVGAGDDEPVHVALPELTRASVASAVARMREAAAPFETARLFRTLLPQLWASVLEPIAPHLPAGALVTLVPAGGLAELPLHAAACAPDADGVWRDRMPGMVFRSAPNARVLRAAQALAASLAHGDLRVLSAAVPSADGLPPLCWAQREADHVAAILGPEHVERPAPATVEAVAAGLNRCAVWHLACHGDHMPAAPLDSRLHLVDGPLSLAAIFGRPSGAQRLAVLSACQTAMVGDEAPDEVIGFPGAMLQAGVAAVVSCLGDVEDDAAMLLVLRFFEGFRRTREPARALAEAQAWLRSATNAEIHAAFPMAYPRSPGATADWDADRRFAAPSTWALFTCAGA